MQKVERPRSGKPIVSPLLGVRPGRLTFKIVHGASGAWWWTVFLPGQTTKFNSYKEAEASLVKVVALLARGQFDFLEQDLNTGDGVKIVADRFKHLLKLSGEKSETGAERQSEEG